MIYHEKKPVHTYTVPGVPVAWARPRTNGRIFFDGQKALKSNWAISLQYQKEEQPFYEKTPLLLIANFYYSPPASLKPNKRDLLVGTPYLYKSDLDNLIKLILDCCNAVLFDDDCTVFQIQASKTYDHQARTEFAIIPIGQPQPIKGKRCLK